jgi:hypothetical protein
MNPTVHSVLWLFVIPMLAQFVYLSFGPAPRWPMWAQGTLVPHAEYTEGCTGLGGSGACSTCLKGPVTAEGSETFVIDLRAEVAAEIETR